MSRHLNLAAHTINQWILGLGATSVLTIGLLAPAPHGQTNEFRVGCALIAMGVILYAESIRHRVEFARDVAIADKERFINDRRRPAIISQPQVTEPITVQPLPLFDLAQLADIDSFPSVAVFAPMGAGKSRLMQWLASQCPGEGVAFDIHGDDWPGMPVITSPDEMLAEMRRDLVMIDGLLKLPMNAKKQLPQRLRLMDECCDTLQELGLIDDEKILDRWISKLVTVCRKLRLRLILGSVTIAADDLKLSASKRNSMTYLFPGKPGIEMAMRDTHILKLGSKQNEELRERLRVSLQGIARPGLILTNNEWHPISIPDYTPPAADSTYVDYVPAQAVPIEDEVMDDPVDLLDRCWQADTADRMSPAANALEKFLQTRTPIEFRTLQRTFSFQGRKLKADELRSTLAKLDIEIIDGVVA